MDVDAVGYLASALAGTSWWTQARVLTCALRFRTHSPSGLIIVGTPDFEPWHLVGHLDDAARLRSDYTTRPVLVRWEVEPDAEDFFSVGLDRLESVDSSQTVLMVLPSAAPDSLLDLMASARRRGVTVLAMDTGDRRLDAVCHTRMSVTYTPELMDLVSQVKDLGWARASAPDPGDDVRAEEVSPEAVVFDVAMHVLAAAAHEQFGSRHGSRLTPNRLRRP